MERYSGIWLPRFRLALTHPLFETSFHLPLSEAILFILFFFSSFLFPLQPIPRLFFFSSLLSLSLLEGTFVSGSTTLEKTLSSRVVYSWFRRPTNSFSPICCAPCLLPSSPPSSSSCSSIKRTRLTRGVYPPRPIN